ncbi:hypothetical protein BH11ARM1_BH11ARM1_04570 [soil metagenome]
MSGVGSLTHVVKKEDFMNENEYAFVRGIIAETRKRCRAAATESNAVRKVLHDSSLSPSQTVCGMFDRVDSTLTTLDNLAAMDSLLESATERIEDIKCEK